jgi:histidinol phosphatase-like enzyme
VETARSIARARGIVLTDGDRGRLDERFPAGRALRFRAGTRPRQVADHRDGEVVLIMGLPGAGKSTAAATFVAQGYARLNRDEAGGSLADLMPALDRAIGAGSSRIVLDNTYVSRKSRAAVIQAAQRRGLPARCIWLSTSLEEAQVNACWRMVSKYGHLLTPEEIRKTSKRDAGVFGPAVQFRYQRELEPPDLSEGFSRIETVPFERRRDPTFTNRAVMLWCDGVLCRSRSGLRTPLSPDDVDVPAARGDVLRRYLDEGWLLLGFSWQPEVTENDVDPGRVTATLLRMQELLGLSMDVEFCPHPGGPPICWCRKPLPGLGVVFIQRHRLDPAHCLYVGSGAQDPGFARRLGFQYRDAAEFFARTAMAQN